MERASVVSKLGSFTISESSLRMGASFGNSALWIHTKGSGAVDSVFLNEIGKCLAGTVAIQYGARVRGLEDGATTDATDSAAAAYTAGFPEPGSRTFEIHPAYQRVSYRLAKVLEVQETTFLPLVDVEPEGNGDPPVLYIEVELFNRDEVPHRVRVAGSAMLRGSTCDDVQARFDDAAIALVAVNRSRPDLVRVFGLSEPPTAYGSDFDFGATYDYSHLPSLSNTTAAIGDVIGRLHLDLAIEAGERRRMFFTLALYATGEQEALHRYQDREDAAAALAHTIAHLENVLQRGRVVTPDKVINDGALWSKVNMRRVMAVYPTGRAFTNDPGKYANVVVRDCAWFVHGSDYFFPSFSRKMLDTIALRQYPNGKLPEYFDAVTGRIEDDGLNINDDTPLYILAVNHHFRATGDREWLQTIYPVVARAARYIISQMDERGLVFCSANDPRGDVWSIAGWRNIIPEYSINGAVTEVNSECVSALRSAAHLAENLGGHDADREDFALGSSRIRAAMDVHLTNPDNGLYYLNIDVSGNAHTDVTGDQIFPVVFRACDDSVAFRIISRLSCPDFWTSAGLRTVSRQDPRYDPAVHSGLLGGVWPGLTWWFAFAAAEYHPQFMVHALRSSFEHYSSNPKLYNTVPGQFSEWFDGEGLSNHGMRLSPWEPPRFLWAAIEGVCGVILTAGPPRIKPLIPADWTWVGLRHLPSCGELISYFVMRETEGRFRIYSTGSVESDWSVELYHCDVSDKVRVFSEHATVIALERDDGFAVFIGNTSRMTIQTPVGLQEIVTPRSRYSVQVYSSERRAWERGADLSSSETAVRLSIEANGFRVLTLQRETV